MWYLIKYKEKIIHPSILRLHIMSKFEGENKYEISIFVRRSQILKPKNALHFKLVIAQTLKEHCKKYTLYPTTPH
jgi:hypothetical protein